MNYIAPRPLSVGDDVDDFGCRSNEQTSWLTHHAKQSVASSTTRVFVVTHDGGGPVVASSAWTMAQFHAANAPRRLTKGSGRYPQPVALLARLEIDRRHEGRGIDAALLRDVIARVLVIADGTGCLGLLIHAEGDEARNFSLHLIPELEPSPTDRLHLVLLMKVAIRTIR